MLVGECPQVLGMVAETIHSQLSEGFVSCFASWTSVPALSEKGTRLGNRGGVALHVSK